MIRNLLFIICLMMAWIGYAQNVTITSQAQIDTFSYTEINGSLIINGTDLEAISGFESLTYIGHSLKIENNDSLRTISGFNNLITVGDKNLDGKKFTISNNISLSSIDGFNKMQIIGSTYEATGFTIENNPELRIIDNFIALKEIYGSIIIRNNSSLKNILNFNNLAIITGNLTIKNENLNEIGGFPKLGRIESSLDLSLDQGLFNSPKKINGFESLTYVGHSLKIENNDSLRTISGFDNLITVGDLNLDRKEFTISNNISLSSIDGFNKMQIIGSTYKTTSFKLNMNANLCNVSAFQNFNACFGSINIQNNTTLSNCCILNCLNLEEIVTNPDNVNITNNNSGCNSLNEIKSSCSSFTCAKDCTETVDDCGICGGTGSQTYYEDLDGDGMGNPDVSIISCCAVGGYVTDNSDTDDCPGIVNECGICDGGDIPDGICDCDGTPETLYYADMDGDGLGDPCNSISTCVQPDGYVTNA